MNSKLSTILFGILGISIFLIFLSIGLHFWSGGDIINDHGIAIDAGSSKTAFFLYDWSSLKINETGMVKEVDFIKLDTRLTDDPEPKLLINTFNDLAKKIHYSRNKQNIPVYLGATAGMRLLNLVSKEKSDKILANVKGTFDQYTETQRQFTIKGVEIISGEKEGLYCWISANYLMGFVPPEDKTHDTVGTLDMGGASAQIAFTVTSSSGNDPEPTNVIVNPKPSEKVKLFGTNYGIYTYSNLCFGKDQAMKRYYVSLILDTGKGSDNIDDPCTHPRQLQFTISRDDLLDSPCTGTEANKEKINLPKYTFNPKHNIEKCKQVTSNLVDINYLKDHFNEINFKQMEESPPDNVLFYAIATYYYSVSQLRKSDLIKFENEEELSNEIEKYCAKSWDEIIKDYKEPEKYLRTYCFALNYVFVTLKKVYKFNGPLFKNIEFRSKFNGHDLGWALGYMLQATNSIPGGTVEEPILNRTGFIIIFLIGFVILIGILFTFYKKNIFNK